MGHTKQVIGYIYTHVGINYGTRKLLLLKNLPKLRATTPDLVTI